MGTRWSNDKMGINEGGAHRTDDPMDIDEEGNNSTFVQEDKDVNDTTGIKALKACYLITN